jgi:hypothetical protein
MPYKSRAMVVESDEVAAGDAPISSRDEAVVVAEPRGAARGTSFRNDCEATEVDKLACPRQLARCRRTPNMGIRGGIVKFVC